MAEIGALAELARYGHNDRNPGMTHWGTQEPRRLPEMLQEGVGDILGTPEDRQSFYGDLKSGNPGALSRNFDKHKERIFNQAMVAPFGTVANTSEKAARAMAAKLADEQRIITPQYRGREEILGVLANLRAAMVGKEHAPLTPLSYFEMGYGKTPRGVTVKEPLRIWAPDIYKDPRQIVEESARKVKPENPLMKELFGVDRVDLDQMALENQHNHSIGDIYQPTRPPSYLDKITTPANAKRIRDVIEVGQEDPRFAGSTGWYMMNPLSQKFEMYHPEGLKGYDRWQQLSASLSPKSSPLKEIQRNAYAHYLISQHGLDEGLRRFGQERAPEGLRGLVPTNAIERLRRGESFHSGDPTDAQKTWLYYNSAMGRNTEWSVPDLHWGKQVGTPDVRTLITEPDEAPMLKKKWGQIKNQLTANPDPIEFGVLGPWYNKHVAEPMGMTGGTAQPLTWNLFGAPTGVQGNIGVPKLEMITNQIDEAAKRAGKPPVDMLIQYIQNGLSPKEMGFAKGGLAQTGFAPGGSVYAPIMDYIRRMLPKDMAQLPMQKIPGGTGRAAFYIGEPGNPQHVAKLAQRWRGLRENEYAGDGYLSQYGLVPELRHRTDNGELAVVEALAPNREMAKKFVRPLGASLEKARVDAYRNGYNPMWFQDVHRTDPRMYKQFEDKGLEPFLNYDLLMGDFVAPRHWRFRGNDIAKPVHIDEGSLIPDLISTKPGPSERAQWDDLMSGRRDYLDNWFRRQKMDRQLQRGAEARSADPQLSLGLSQQDPAKSLDFRQSLDFAKPNAPSTSEIDAALEQLRQKQIERGANAPELPAHEFADGGDVDLSAIADAAEQKYQLQPGIVHAVMQQESNGDINAKSFKGARGLMQFMPATAKAMKVKMGDPTSEIHGGAEYLKKLIDQFGDVRKALAAYNWGPGNVSKYGLEKMPKETREYLDRVLKRLLVHGGLQKEKKGSSVMATAPDEAPNPITHLPPMISASTDSGVRGSVKGEAGAESPDHEKVALAMLERMIAGKDPIESDDEEDAIV